MESDVWTDGDVAFATSLCQFILEHIASKTLGGSFESEEKMIAEEKRLLELYGPLLTKFVSNYNDTQLQCLFGIQRFCVDAKFPKGLHPPPPSSFVTATNFLYLPPLPLSLSKKKNKNKQQG